MSTFDEQTDFSFLNISVKDADVQPAKPKQPNGCGVTTIGNNLVTVSLTKTNSVETRAKISASKKGKRMSQESIDKMAQSKKGGQSPMKGRTHSEEARALMSERHSGGPKVGHAVSAETRAKISAINSKPVMTPNGVYPSIKAVAEASGFPGHVVRRWLKRFPTHYYFITKESV